MSLPVTSSETTGTAVHDALLGLTVHGSTLLDVCVISLVVVVVLAAMVVEGDPVVRKYIQIQCMKIKNVSMHAL